MKGLIFFSKHVLSLILCCVALGLLVQTGRAQETQTVDQEKIVQTVKSMRCLDGKFVMRSARRARHV